MREGTGVSERLNSATEKYDSVAHRAEDSTRRIAAAIAGALEGFIEALDRYDIGNEGQRALTQAGEIARAAAVEGQTQAQTPEMQQLGRGIKTVGHATAEAAGTVGTGIRTGATNVKDGVVGAAHTVGDGVRHAKENVHDRYESAKFAVNRTAEDVKVKGQAVAETGRRARVAPGHIMHEVGEAVAAWKRALITTIAMMAVIAVVGITAFVVLTMALISGLTLLVGWVPALFLVTLLYLVIAGICFAVSKSAKTKAAHEREERMENAREEARHVVRPVKDAFGRGRGI